MARAKSESTFLSQLATFDIYKRNQGRVVRQLTFVALAITVCIGAWRLWGFMGGYPDSVRGGVPAALAAIGLWLSYRLVNYPRFADFLVGVETEMNKVSWPTWDYLLRATAVVVAVMFFLGAVLWLYDLFWMTFFDLIGFLDINALNPDPTDL